VDETRECWSNIHVVATSIWKNIYSLENLANWNPMADYWLPIAFHDAALLHALIGCADVYASGYMTISDGQRGLRHMQTAISIVNKRLEYPKTISSGTLVIVASLAMLEVCIMLLLFLLSLTIYLL
jgi:hypothetical protein